MPYLAEPAQAVHRPCLVQLLIHAGYRRDIDDGRPAKILPYICAGKNAPEVIFLIQKGYRFANPSEMQEDGIDISLCPEQGEQDAGNHNPGDKIG